ncbi:MAG: aldo/keto reductase [Janthinobacterium lividum]
MLATRELGASGLVVSAQGLGCMGMSQAYGSTDDVESVATLRYALDHGVTLIDTADVYGNGANEQLIARAIAGRRSDVVLATKFALSARNGALTVNGRPDYVHAACEASLQRLGTDYIDLYYQHRVDPEVPIEETVGAMAELVEQGKVRYLGLSEASARSIERAVAVHPIAALQSEWSLWTRDLEESVLAVARRHGVGIVAYSPLGRGFLTGTVTSLDDLEPSDGRRNYPRFQSGNFAHNLRIVDEVRALAEQLHCTPAQLALAWVSAQGDDVVPIPGTKRRRYLTENVEAAAVHLTEADLRRLDSISPVGAAAGHRSRGALDDDYGDSPQPT